MAFYVTTGVRNLIADLFCDGQPDSEWIRWIFACGDLRAIFCVFDFLLEVKVETWWYDGAGNESDVIRTFHERRPHNDSIVCGVFLSRKGLHSKNAVLAIASGGFGYLATGAAILLLVY